MRDARHQARPILILLIAHVKLLSPLTSARQQVTRVHDDSKQILWKTTRFQQQYERKRRAINTFKLELIKGFWCKVGMSETQPSAGSATEEEVPIPEGMPSAALPQSSRGKNSYTLNDDVHGP